MHLQPGGACNCSREAVSRLSGAGCYYSGHGGDTFGFVTMSGFFPTLNASISLAMNQRHVGLLDALQCELVSTLLPLANYTTCAAVEDKLCGGEAARSSAATCLACMRDSAHRAELAAVGVRRVRPVAALRVRRVAAAVGDVDRAVRRFDEGTPS